MRILVTGAAGFIGYHLTKALLERGDEVIGLDSLNPYYDVNLKLGRLKDLGLDLDLRAAEEEANQSFQLSSIFKNFKFIKINLEDKDHLEKIFKVNELDAVCNLAAQAGVRYSLEDPQAYINSNIIGFLNILENCKKYSINNLTYASSSSVYGLNEKFPFSTNDNVDHPISLYAASKKSNELMAHTYSHLFGIQTTGLRFFTVYGPWGRPDMALFKFTKAAFEETEIEVYNQGNMIRDFTYVDDVIEGVKKVIDEPASPDSNWDPNNPNPSKSSAPYRIYNIGNSNPVNLLDFIKAIENETGKKIRMNLLPMQPGDVAKTFADVEALVQNFDYQPSTSIKQGISNFISWYRAYYGE
ncbi:MAG: NAD-dependent epimerase [Candidatus Marinimicrobia bacterium]|nr:NAD-dependent epimerase [Candidatus Neomarinimicrobiota bacterium]|tara:strand:+ start:1523 stop:2590 length:1068 start_codon:yes stop_codon:yes gene_type:complete